MIIGQLISSNVAMANAPSQAAFVNLEDRDTFETVYDAFFFELPKLALLCAMCHARKTFAEIELLFLRALPTPDAIWGLHRKV